MNMIRCYLNMAIGYMLVGESEKTRDILNKYRDVNKSKGLIYIKIVLAVEDGNLEEAIKLNNKFQKYKNKRFIPQQASANQLLKMIETKEFDEKLYSSTKFPLIKEICLRYKNT